MALFKISKGSANKLNNQPKTEGYCWFTTDDGKFYIDVDDNTRQILNAGHADTADKLKTARTISLTGDAVGAASFDGSENIEIEVVIEKNNEGLTEPIILHSPVSYGDILPTNPEEGQLFFLGEDSEELSSLPKGGFTGQYLVKVSDEDGDAEWQTLNLPELNYLPLTGGKMTGVIDMGDTSTTNGPQLRFYSNKRNYIWAGYANDNGSWYLWDTHNSKGIMTSDVNGNNSFHGSAEKLIPNKTVNPIATADDTTGNWSGQGVSAHWYNSSGTITDKPSDYGYVLSVGGYASEVQQLWFSAVSGNLYHRGGNSSGWSGSWHKIWEEGNSITGAVWNDYAECRESDCEEAGYVLFENGDDTLSKTTERLASFAGVSSDTWGFSQGKTEKAKTHIAVAGRVLVYPYQDRNNYKPGDCVCAAPGGTVDIMTREEIIQWPDRIVGTVSCVPDYEKWGGGEGADRDPVEVDGRIWIKVK